MIYPGPMIAPEDAVGEFARGAQVVNDANRAAGLLVTYSENGERVLPTNRVTVMCDAREADRFCEAVNAAVLALMGKDQLDEELILTMVSLRRKLRQARIAALKAAETQPRRRQ